MPPSFTDSQHTLPAATVYVPTTVSAYCCLRVPHLLLDQHFVSLLVCVCVCVCVCVFMCAPSFTAYLALSLPTTVCACHIFLYNTRSPQHSRSHFSCDVVRC